MGKSLQPRLAVQSMAGYTPPTGGRAGKLRLDFNENTVGCSPKVAAFLREQLSAERLSIYPEYTAARAELAAHFKVRELEMLLTNGTDEAIQILINTFVDPGDEVIALRPSYAMYRFYAELAGATLRQLNYRPETLDFPLEELLEVVSERTRAILIANPNNPTGTVLTVEQIELIAERAPAAALLIDEAYYEFSGLTCLGLLNRFSNLFISRTFSKAYGLAGMRLGCLLGGEQNLRLVDKVQSPYSVNALAVLAARVAITDSAYIEDYVGEILAARDYLCAGLTKLDIPFFGRAGNFVLMRLGDRAAEVHRNLAAVRVLVRNRSHEIKGAVRVTVGTRGQTKRFLTELERIWRTPVSATPWREDRAFGGET